MLNINNIIHNKNKKLNNLFFKLFPSTKCSNFCKLLLTNEAIFSISKPNDSEIISENIKSVLGDDIVITDATANVGGNSINFCDKFKHVNSVEIDKTNFYALGVNIGVYNIKNIKLYCENYLNIFNKIKQDVVFIDPPWGGRNYKDFKVLDLFLNDKLNNKIYIANIVLKILDLKIAKMIVIKVPFNFSFNKFSTILKAYKIFKYPINNYFILQIT